MTNTKKQKVLKITAILLAVITIVTACVIGICYSVNVKRQDNLPQAEITEPEFEYSEPKVYNMPKAMTFTAKTLAAAQANGQTVDVKIQASVTPWDAANQQVDYSIAWGAAPTHGKEAVTDYVTVTQDSDGSLTATISCKKAFGGDKIIVTVTTRDGGFTANCTVSFVGVASTISITNSTLNPISDTNRGNYYQLGTNKTYNFTVNLGNIFNTIGSKNLTVTLGGVGELYFGDEFVDGSSGMGSFSNMAKRKMSDIVNKFIASATISGTTLTVKTGTVVVENYYDEMVNDTEYFTGTTYKGRYVFEDEYGLTGGKDFETNSKANIAALPSCYFTITVKDTVSGLSETVKVWLVTSVKSVSLNKSTVNI
ncbi:MAG TPA: hypothetical protein DHU79_02935 [Clostridiales bacterium]|nr:hypothetical protein [Clostridiales bacterium]